MEALKQSRGHLKGSITRLHNFALTLTPDFSVAHLEIRLERLSDTWKEFCSSQNEYFSFHAEEGYGDPEADFETVETKYIEAKSALLEAIRKKLSGSVEEKVTPPVANSGDKSKDSLTGEQSIDNSQMEQINVLRSNEGSEGSTSSHARSSSSVELPVLKLEPFSSVYREWPGFRDMFLGAIDCKDNLSGAQKFRYLKSFLRDDAAKLLNHLDVTDSNYEQAWEKLERRYDKPSYIVIEYVDSFIKLPNVDSGHLRKLVDNADEILRGLTALKSEGRDPWLIFLLLNKTDGETRKAWALDSINAEEPTVYDLIEFLDKRCSALEASELKNRSLKGTSRSAHAGNVKSLNVSKSLCPKCKSNHSLPYCSEFLSMPIPSRRDFVRDEKLCYNCLGIKHSASRCRVRSRCSHCRNRHHSVVHQDQPSQLLTEDSSSNANVAENSLPSPSSSLTIASNCIREEKRSSGILPTIVVKIIDAVGIPQSCRLLLDTGSQVSFVTDACVKRLGLRRRRARLPISGISSVEAGVTQGVVTLHLLSVFDSNCLTLDAYILKRITSLTPLTPLEIDNPRFFKDLQLADPDFSSPGVIDILVGSDQAWNILCDGRRADDRGQLIAHDTIFGWIITGNLPAKEIVSLHTEIDIDLEALLKSFWETEEIPQNIVLEDENQVESHFASTFSRAPDNKYVVQLPFREQNFKFGNTLSGALSRLATMERRFARDPPLHAEYCKFMQAYKELGQMELVPRLEVEPTCGEVFYLPHHAVVTNKLRVVFDGSHMDSKGVSLNEMLYPGPPLQRNLLNVCLRFRLHKYVFCADIVKMFRQIWLDKKDRDYQRIVWRESPQAPVQHFRLRTVTYGTSPAPFLAMRVLKQLAKDYQQQFPEAAHSVMKDFYVDDILTGCDSVIEILELKRQLIELLKCGGLELSKWSSNCWPILCSDSNQTISMDLDGNCTKVLGLVWNPFRDVFTFKISVDEQASPTKRNLLSEVAKIFDPMGFLAPSTILLKMLLQELWVHKSKIDWKDPLPAELADKWNFYRKDLACFEEIEIRRRCIYNCRCFDLLGFSDASEKAYSAVVYARSISEHGEVETHLVAAKTRVAPVKQLTIPRLELCGALLLCRLIDLIRSSLDVKPSNIFAFCDSQIVLAWLSSSPRRWNTFVANRTSQILETLPRSVWNHVRSEENPADCASRGIEPRKLLELDIWWRGPYWASKDIREWPIESNGELDRVPEERKKVLRANVSSAVEHFLENLMEKIPSWTMLVRVVSYTFRFIRNARAPKGKRNPNFLSCAELSAAKQYCLLQIQGVFKEEIQALKTKGCNPAKSKLSSLSPFIDQVGLLRVGGRIANAEGVPYNIKHPIILPKHHPGTKLIIRDAHLRFLHAGVSELFSLIRQEFWILGSRNLIRRVVHDCIKCFRLRQSTSKQLMGDLPTSRLSTEFPFAETGVDYAGPITLRLCRGRKSRITKGYFAIFVCMATKALHLEVVSDLSTDAFLAALRRFIARRGKCNVIRSDNGSNFKGAARKLSEVYHLLRSKHHNELVCSTLAADQITWDFIPPQSPHFGGLWEAGVKCVKQHLRRVVGNNTLTFEEMSTLLAQVEALLNSRPLCAISDSDLNPLTPSHFLIGRPYTAMPKPSYLETAANRLGRWELIQNMTQGFWHRWNTDYLTSLQQRPKWRGTTRDFKVGDLVVVKEPNLPSKRSIARVEEVHPGKDGHVRVVTIRTSTTVLKRPITKLALLPAPEVPSGGVAC